MPLGVTLLFEDDHLLVVEKPQGLLTIGTERRKTGTLYAKLTEYVRKGNYKSKNRIFIVHRLDRDASGVIVFAKDYETKVALQARWKDTSKRYLAVVHGAVKEKDGVITSYLIETKARQVRSTRDEKQGKLSRTAYRVLAESHGLTLLEVDLLTGRKHQIRVHLAEAGHPIVGDRRYGAPDIGETRLALHATSIAFTHPATGEKLAIETRTPEYFDRLMRGPAIPARGSRPHGSKKKTPKR